MKYKGKTITKRKDRNLWQLRFRKNGKARVVYAKTQKEVIAKFNKAIKETEEEPKKTKQEYTLEEWFNIYFDLYRKNKNKDSSTKLIFYDWKYLKDLHKTKLSDITPIKIQSLLNNIDTSCKKKKAHSLLSSILEKAVINGFIKNNVAKLVNKPIHITAEKIILTNTKQQKFIEECNKSKYKVFHLLCLFQGLRIGECKAIQVNDINFENNTLRIDESISHLTKRKETKNKQSNRIMPLFNNTKEILKDFIKNKTNNDYIFQGTQYNNTSINDDLAKISEKIGIQKITSHCLRHTFITRCQENNIPLFVIQKWVGHQKGSNVTTKIYTHISEETSMKYADNINNSVNTINNKKS